MKAFSKVLILSALALSACGQKGGVSPVSAVAPKAQTTSGAPAPTLSQPSAPATTSQAHGGVDGSGGNSIDGKPLDSYVVNVTDLPAFKVVSQKLCEADRYCKTFGPSDYSSSYKTLKYLESHRVWYMVPRKLDRLSKEQIGSAVSADQTALQNFDSVWIDKNQFDKMSVDDQASLILHELLMGVKLARLLPLTEQCLIFNNESLSQCTDQRSDSVRKRTPSDLKPKDYDDIRKTVQLIFHDQQNEKDSKVPMDQIFGMNGFNLKFGYIYWQEPEYVFPSTEFLRELDRAMYGPNKLTYFYDFADFHKANPSLSQTSPSAVSGKLNWKPSGTCSVTMSHQGPIVTGSIHMNGKDYSFTMNTKALDSQKSNDHNPDWSLHPAGRNGYEQNKMVYTYEPSRPLNVKEGDLGYVVNFAFADTLGGLTDIGITEFRYVKSDDVESGYSELSIDESDFQLSCSTQKMRTLGDEDNEDFTP